MSQTFHWITLQRDHFYINVRYYYKLVTTHIVPGYVKYSHSFHRYIYIITKCKDFHHKYTTKLKNSTVVYFTNFYIIFWVILYKKNHWRYLNNVYVIWTSCYTMDNLQIQSQICNHKYIIHKVVNSLHIKILLALQNFYLMQFSKKLLYSTKIYITIIS